MTALEAVALKGDPPDSFQVLLLIDLARRLFVVADEIGDATRSPGMERHEYAAQLDALRDESRLDPLPDDHLSAAPEAAPAPSIDRETRGLLADAFGIFDAVLSGQRVPPAAMIELMDRMTAWSGKNA